MAYPVSDEGSAASDAAATVNASRARSAASCTTSAVSCDTPFISIQSCRPWSNSPSAAAHSRAARAIHCVGTGAVIASGIALRKRGMAFRRAVIERTRRSSGAKSRIINDTTEKIASPVHSAGLRAWKNWLSCSAIRTSRLARASSASSASLLARSCAMESSVGPVSSACRRRISSTSSARAPTDQSGSRSSISCSPVNVAFTGLREKYCAKNRSSTSFRRPLPVQGECRPTSAA